jgi:hypothetical protein
MLLVAQTKKESNEALIIEWLGKDVEGSDCGLIKVLSYRLPGETVEKYANLRRAGFRARI